MKISKKLLTVGFSVAMAVLCTGATEVKWEAENAVKTDLTTEGKFRPNNDKEKAVLSNGKWLNGDFKKGSFAEYSIEVPEDGKYSFYIRRFWIHGPIRWRFNEDKWTELKGRHNFNKKVMRKYVPVGWVKAGVVDLKKGKHTFRFELLKKIKIWNKAYGYDCFLLTDGDFKTSKQTIVTPPVVNKQQTMWDTKEFYLKPEVYACPDILKQQETAEIKGVLIEGVPYAGKKTKFFAWYGIPRTANKDNPVPAMVLIHGGGGTAFKSWVERWLKRGYAALAMSTNGNYPVKNSSTQKHKPWLSNPNDIPLSWGDFKNINKPVKDQWTYRAVATVLKSHSFLRSLPEIDKEKIGLTGISWGGYLALISSGVDKRYKFTAPVYGCGFYGEGSRWRDTLIQMGDKGKKWVKLWDAGRYTPYITIPMLFCTGTNDRFFPLSSWQKTVFSTKGTNTLCLKIRMPHSHPPIGDPPEITAYANHFLKGTASLPKIKKQGISNNIMWVEYDSVTPLSKAVICFTKSKSSVWKDKYWEKSAANIDLKNKRVQAEIPKGATVFYLNLIDKNNMIVSSVFVLSKSAP